MLHYLFPNWPAPAHIKACTSLRFDGVSEGPYASFNLGKGGDSPEAVIANRQRLMAELNLIHEPVWLKQVHGTHAIQADTMHAQSTEADASFTSVPNIVCAVITADCLPLLLCNTAGDQVAAIHAGWRGLAAGIIENTLSHLKQPQDQWLAWLGPAIGPSMFEVGEEVRQAFLQHDPKAQTAFKAKSHDKWLADLYALAKQRLHACGVSRIYGGGFCTYSDASRFYSYRRGQGKTGRMASLIWLQGNT
ncbi:MAG TPA: peptidoglycan editing factor PgeF [Gammaproteobacteria bacterium]|nr:peptidoglycan editing factor PgeF [Gammaproteobacteria bacterium]